MTKSSGRILGGAAVVLTALWSSLGAGALYVPRQPKMVVRTSLQRSAPRPQWQPRVERTFRRGRRGFASDRVLVRFRPGVDETYAEALLRSYGFPRIHRISAVGAYSIGTAGTITARTEPAGATGDSYVWNVPGVRQGQYYLGAVLDDGTHPPVVAYADGTLGIGGPAVKVYSPTTIVQWIGGGTVAIRYEVASPRGGTVTVFADTDGALNSGDEILLATQPVQSGPVTYTWTSGPLPVRTYHVGVQVDDHLNEPVGAYASGLIQEVAPTVTVTAPTGVTSLPNGSSVDVTFLVNAGSGSTQLFYDQDGSGGSGDEVMVGAPSPLAVSGVATTQALAVAAPAPGIYHVGVKLTIGTSAFWGYAPGTVDVSGGPISQVVLTAPAADINIQRGAPLTVTWTSTAIVAGQTLSLYYDDQSGTSGPIATDLAISAATHTWTVPGDLWNSPASTLGYYIRGDVMEGGVLRYSVFSPGRVRIQDPSFYSVPLWQVEMLGVGRTFHSDKGGSNLGGVAAQVPWSQKPSPRGGTRRQPGISFDGDAYDDFMLVAPTSFPFYYARPGAGVACLIHSDPALLFPLGATTAVPFTAIGTSLMPGTIFQGPAYGSSSEGIGAVTVSRSVDNDQVPDILFYFPWVDKVYQEQQDYDPWHSHLDLIDSILDSNSIQIAPRTYTNTGRAPAGTRDPASYWQTDQNYFSSSFVVAVAGSNAQISSPPGSFNPNNTIIGLDTVGQGSSAANPAYTDSHPLVVKDPVGLRMYDFGLFRIFPRVDWNGSNRYMILQLSGGSLPQNDYSRWGECMVAADVNGDLQQEWIFTQPAKPYIAGNFAEGWLDVMYTTRSSIWTANRATFENTVPAKRGPIKVVQVIKDVDTSQTGNQTASDGNTYSTVIRTETTITLTLGDYTYPTLITGASLTHVTKMEERFTAGPQSGQLAPTQPTPPPDRVTQGTRTTVQFPELLTSQARFNDPFPTMVYSWPYAVPVGAYDLQLNYASVDGGTPTFVSTDVNTDTRGRDYFFPTYVDSIQGFNDPVTFTNPGVTNELLGHLKGLVNVGDFNTDGREDIAVGAPEANPDGLADAGCAFLIYGRADFANHGLSTVGLVDQTALPGIKIKGNAAGQKLGASLASAGDFNGDGWSDWAIGIPGYDGGKGAVAIVYGHSPYIVGVFTLADIGTAALPGVILTGIAGGDALGSQLACLGDVDRDGYDDIGVVAPGATAAGTNGVPSPGIGVVYLIYGGARYTGVGPALSVVGLGGSNLPGKIYVPGTPASSGKVLTVAPAGDVDNDGRADFLIGDPNVSSNAGEVYLIRGGARTIP